MRLGKMGNQLAQVSSGYRTFQFFGLVALWILGWHAISVQVFTRRSFGERYMSLMNVLFGITAIGLYTGLGNIFIGNLAHEQFSGLMEFLYTAAVCLSAYHLAVIWWKNRKHVIWHSMYSGEPNGSSLLAFTGLSEGTLKQWVEPIVLFFLAYVASHSHQHAVAVWLYIGAFSVFVHETLAAHMEKAQLLDQRDAMIEANYRMRIMSGKQVRQEQGFSMSQSSVELMRQTPEISDELPEDVQGMLDREVAQ
jgi:hypothetical protein